MRTFSALLALVVVGCTGGTTEPEPQPSGIKHDKGVDVEKKVIRIGTLDDSSGPAAAIGKHFVTGKRLLAAQINAGGSGLLPEGWTVELVERDHGYNPQQSVQAYDQIRDEVLFVGTSFGTPNTLPLIPKLEEDNMVAYPASLSSLMAENAHTPPIGASYKLEGMRAVDYMATQADDIAAIKAGVVYQQDDYGKDGLAGVKAAAAEYGIEVVSEQTVSPGQTDMTALVTSLKDAGATHVFLAVLPSSSGPVLGTAAKLQYMPMWLGATPAWVDAFFAEGGPLPHAVFANYVQVNSLPFWGEDRPGMSDFEATFEKHGGDMAKDFYVLLSYGQGIIGVEAAKRAIENEDVTRAGYMTALKSIKDFNAGGFLPDIDLSTVPYAATEQVRVLKPDFAAGSWTTVMRFGKPGKPAPEPGAGDAEEGEVPPEGVEGEGEGGEE